MRVIAGSLRGRPLKPPPGRQTRPVTDRVKETLFNIIGARFGQPGLIPEIDVLDLFAGTGGLGIEAVSRGATGCLFVERSGRSLRVLRENVSKLGLLGPCRIAADNAWTMRVPPSRDAAGYGLVFADPPYRAADDQLGVLDLLERIGPALRADGLVMFRHEAATRLDTAALRTLACRDERAIGSMRIWLFARRS